MNKSKNTDDFLNEKRKKKNIFQAKEKSRLIQFFNERCAVVLDGHRTKYVIKRRNGAMRLLDEKSAKGWFKNIRYINKDGDEKDAFDIWFKDGERKAYDEIVFNPDLLDAENKPNELNLFSGWGCEPNDGGDYSLLKSHMLENMCQNDQGLFDYLMDWSSQTFCETAQKPGTALVFRGKPGVGKSIFAVSFREIVGLLHSKTLHHKDQIVGKFNSHYRNTILVVIEEAFFAGDPTARTVLNHLITDKLVATEGKGENLEDGQNFVRFIIIANHDWVAPVVAGDRRYVIFDVSDAHKEDKPYFDAMLKQMKEGGAQKLLYDLIERNKKFLDLPAPPMTDAKREQLLLGMSADVEWLLDAVEHGRFPFRETGRVDLRDENPLSMNPGPQIVKRKQVEWPENGGEVERDAIAASYKDICPGHKGRNASSIKVGKFLKKWLPGIKDGRITVDGKRVYTYKLPSLQEAQAELEKTMQFKFTAIEDAAPANDDAAAAQGDEAA